MLHPPIYQQGNLFEPHNTLFLLELFDSPHRYRGYIGDDDDEDSNSTPGIAYRNNSERINKQYLQYALRLIQQGWHRHLSTSVGRSIFGIHLESSSLLAELYQRQ